MTSGLQNRKYGSGRCLVGTWTIRYPRAPWNPAREMQTPCRPCAACAPCRPCTYLITAFNLPSNSQKHISIYIYKLVTPALLGSSGRLSKYRLRVWVMAFSTGKMEATKCTDEVVYMLYVGHQDQVDIASVFGALSHALPSRGIWRIFKAFFAEAGILEASYAKACQRSQTCQTSWTRSCPK